MAAVEQFTNPESPAVPSSKVSPEAMERLRATLQNWGHEVSGAQERLQNQIREAATELSQIEDLLAQRLNGAAIDELVRKIDALEEDNQALRRALADRDALIESLRTSPPDSEVDDS